MKEPVDHILRPSLPWRSQDVPAITECGGDVCKGCGITPRPLPAEQVGDGLFHGGLMWNRSWTTAVVPTAVAATRPIADRRS